MITIEQPSIEESHEGETSAHGSSSLTEMLIEQNYWPARAFALLNEGKYSSVVELCKEHIHETPELVSVQVLYALALYHSNQMKNAVEQFYQVLHTDPDNLVALKYLGDIAFAEKDEFSAVSYYNRVMEIDPFCQGLHCDLKSHIKEEIHTVTLVRKEEPERIHQGELRAIPFCTETMGDLYLTQGHAKLAASVFRSLNEKAPSPRLLEKLKIAEEKS
jgi:tetratricopeptide (TPR) repeat protein